MKKYVPQKLFIPNRRDYAVPCRATASGSGKRCKNMALPGSPFCRRHGGGNPFEGKPRMGKGFLLSQSGRRSKMFPLSLAAKYQIAVEDKELLNLREDLAVFEVRLEQLLGRAQSGEQQEAWSALGQKFGELMLAARSGSAAEVEIVGQAVEKIFAEVEKDYQIWQQIFQLLDLRRKTVEAEQKRLVIMNQMVKIEDAMKLVAQLLAAIKRHIGKPPEQAYAAIAYEFALTTGDLYRGRTESGSEETLETDRPAGMDNPELLDS